MQRKSASGQCAGFTLLEILTVIVVIGLLAVLLAPAADGIRKKAQGIKCANNLRSLHVAANLYVEQNNSWPQIPIDPTDQKAYGRQWIEVLRPFGPQEVTWICPTIQRLLNNPDFKDPANFRTDYLASTFSPGRMLPFKWSTQPWFLEKGSVHGKGNLLIFADGSIKPLNEVVSNQ